MIAAPRASHLFQQSFWLSQNNSSEKSHSSRIVKKSQEFSLFDISPEAFQFNFSFLKTE